MGDLGPYCLTSEGLTEGPCRYPPNLQVEGGYGSFNFLYGPSTGGLLESVAFEILTYGESIEKIERLSYKPREIRVRDLAPDEVLMKVERINVPFSASHTIAFLSAVEDALDVNPPEEVLESRIAQLELERVRNHLLVIQRLAEAASFLVPSYRLLYYIEEVNRAISKSCGHRYFLGANFLGGTRCQKLEVPKIDLEEIWDLTNNRIFIDRLQGNGIVREEWAIGPAARGAGMNYDARSEVPDLKYTNYGFRIVVEKDGDAFSRMMVRLREIEVSMEILEGLEFKPVRYDIPKGSGTGLGRVESPSGDLAYLIQLDQGKVKELHLFPPSRVNSQLFLRTMRGNIFTDFPFNWESFGIWISELEVSLS
ncbi:hypothetical protein [Metallosphaera tengchongensis]|uniref:NADH-quinone oxidoreductase subunit D-related protein n=1 Tax=Metallosphaera tengchongensis TaxID=1532350 RepID=UPI001FE72E2F|nr:hypothetical protein [Metallosphaera tengchongensis]